MSTGSPRTSDDPLIHWGKAIASQLIVWHHLVLYGPMARTASPLAPDLFDWLAGPARLAVQVFLVIGGFLAARTLLPDASGATRVRPSSLPALLAGRARRLLEPYLGALLLAVVCAWLARSWMNDADTPAAPDGLQLLAHMLLLHDITGRDALSAGVWYVAIDLQLYALLACIAAVVGGSFSLSARRGLVAAGLIGTAMAAAWFWFNRRPDLDIWGVYFFGSYGLGVLAHWVRAALGARAGLPALLLAALLAGVALWLDWRDRILLATVIALALAFNVGGGWLERTRLHAVMVRLSAISYGVFLCHYPISLLVAPIVTWLAPASPEWNLAGLAVAWLLSLPVGERLCRWFTPAPAAAAPRSASAPAAVLRARA